MEHRWAEPGLAEEGPHPREDQGQAGVRSVWGPRSDLEPEFNRETSSGRRLWFSPGCPAAGEGRHVSQPLWGSAGEVRAAEGGADTPPQRLLPRGSQAAHSILPRPGNSVQTPFENAPQTLDPAVRAVAW